jgi:hypothetical protein
MARKELPHTLTPSAVEFHTLSPHFPHTSEVRRRPVITHGSPSVISCLMYLHGREGKE